MEKIVFKPYNIKRTLPIVVGPLPDKTGKLYTGQGKYGYLELLTKEERDTMPYIIDENTRIRIEPGKILYLNDPIDAANWAWMQKHPYISLEKEKDSSNRDAVFYVDRPEAEAKEKVTRSKKVVTVKYKIQVELSLAEKVKVASSLGFPGAEHADANILESWLLSQVDEFPDTVEKLIDPKNKESMEAQAMFHDFLRLGILKKVRGGHYKFGGPEGESLGHTEEMAINFMLDPANKDVVLAMRSQLLEVKS